MDPETEIRKLSPRIFFNLIIILENSDSWKKLMQVIPKELNNPKSKSKYTIDDIRKIEEVRKQQCHAATSILLDEWSTSGRIRPNLIHLKDLLIKAELYRAADYVAVELLKLEKPSRPNQGPAAPVNLTDSVIKALNEPFESSILDEMSTHSSLYGTMLNSNVYNQNIDVSSNMSSYNKNVIIPQLSTSNNNNQEATSVTQNDIQREDNLEMKIQKFNQDGYNQPDLSLLMGNAGFSQEGFNVPAISKLLPPSSSRPSEFDLSNNPNIPALSQLMSNISYYSSEYNKSEVGANIPALSKLFPLNDLTSTQLIESNKSDQKAYNIPKLPIFDSPSQTQSISFNTTLPHFNYEDIKKFTNNFDSTPHSEVFSGRMLGTGGFGSVYLASGLMDKLVAVKRLNNAAYKVNGASIVEKEFKKEIEIIHKCRHVNLLLPLGYSCDGPEYCLVYEYISGGSLKETLEFVPSILTWKDRINITIGTSKGIAYLHSKNIVHRDIKSANILLDSNYNAKLCDFGLVKFLPEQHTMMATTQVGTIAYAPPEIVTFTISPKMDTYSYGIVMLEILTSLPVFEKTREKPHLIDFVMSHCQNNTIEPVLDKRVGDPNENELTYLNYLFDTSKSCIKKDKDERPLMIDVSKDLETMENRIFFRC